MLGAMDRRLPRLMGAGVVVLVLASAGPVAAEQQSGRQTSVEALAQRLARWVADSDPQAHQKALARVQEGVPPGALAAFLAAARQHPDPIYRPVLERAATYRNVIVRGHALAALAELSPELAQRCIRTAADDQERRIRRLAWALEQLHPSPASHEIVIAMLQRDPELAEELAAERRARQEAEDEAEIVVFDEEPAEPSP